MNSNKQVWVELESMEVSMFPRIGAVRIAKVWVELESMEEFFEFFQNRFFKRYSFE